MVHGTPLPPARLRVLAGTAFYVAMMTVGYYYNVTFVQLGLVDLGTRVVGLREVELAAEMALLAVLTAAVAVAYGIAMTRRGWGADLVLGLRVALGVVLAQLVLTAWAPQVRDPGAFRVWIVAASVALGVGIPVTYSLAVHLVARHSRGTVAAIVTALAYPAAVLLSSPWRIDHLSAQLLPGLAGGAAFLAVVALRPPAIVRELARQHERPEFGLGRFVRLGPDGRPRVRGALAVAVLALFGIYFVDSLGFLRITATPDLIQTTWQSDRASDLLLISAYHVVGAFVAGVLYGALTHRSLFLWVFSVFALVHLGYVLHGRVFPGLPTSLAPATLYAFAVSMYTVVSLAIWPDLSTPRTVGLYTGIGVALSGWTATFLSTALAVRWRVSGLSVVDHLDRVAAVALGFLAVTLAWGLWETWRRERPGETGR